VGRPSKLTPSIFNYSKKIPTFCRFEMFKLAGEGENSCRKLKPTVLQPNVLKEPEPENLSTENHAPAIS
jgi:hypothetical protein